MKTTVTLYVYSAKSLVPWEADEIIVKTYDSTDGAYRCSHILIDTVETEIEFTMPSEREILNRVVANLKAEKTNIEADAYIQAKAIQDKIDSLLCIEHKQGVEA